MQPTRPLHTPERPSPAPRLRGATRLDLSAGKSGGKTEALNTLPPEIAELTKLTKLYLNGTGISDLRPIRVLRKLVNEPNYSGLTFKNCAAAKTDRRIGEIAEVEGNSERAAVLFEYLEGWPPPGEKVPLDAGHVPQFDLPDDAPMRSRRETPDEDDPDQRGLQQDLQGKIVNLLETLAGSNEYAHLSDAASHYRDRLAPALPDIPLILLYSAANTLRTSYEAHLAAIKAGRETDALPPVMAAHLQDVVEIHALFFSGFAKAVEIHRKMLAGLTGQRDPALLSQAEPLVQSLADKPQVLVAGDQAAMADDLAAAKGEGASAEIGETLLRGRLGNMLGAFGRRVLQLGVGGVGILTGHYFLQWVIGYEALIGSWLQVAYGAGAGWFTKVMEIIRSIRPP